MSLTNWGAAGWLVEHKATPEEIRDLFAVAERDLKDSAVTGISSDTQLGLAYNAALQVSTAALAAAGYRAAREKKHYVTLQSLIHTIAADAKLVGVELEPPNGSYLTGSNGGGSIAANNSSSDIALGAYISSRE